MRSSTSHEAFRGSASTEVVSVNWWKSSWHRQSTSEQLSMQLLTPPSFVD
jgi:hypothetical protein